MKSIKLNTLIISAPYGSGVTTLINELPSERNNSTFKLKMIDLRFDRRINYIPDGVGKKAVNCETNDGRKFRYLLDMTNYVEEVELIKDLIGSYHIIFISQDKCLLDYLNEEKIPFFRISYMKNKEGLFFKNWNNVFGRVQHHFSEIDYIKDLRDFVNKIEMDHCREEVLTVSYEKSEEFKYQTFPTYRTLTETLFISDVIDEIILLWNRFYNQYYNDNSIKKSFIPFYNYWKTDTIRNIKYNDDLLDYFKSFFPTEYAYINQGRHSNGIYMTVREKYKYYLMNVAEGWEYVGEGDNTYPVYRFLFKGTLYYVMIGCVDNINKVQVHTNMNKLKCDNVIVYNKDLGKNGIPEVCL